MNFKSIQTALVVGLFLLPALGTRAAAQPYTLEISREPPDGGAYHVEPDEETYASGTLVTVYAVPFDGFTFVGWEGGISASESQLTFEMTADTSLTAMFEAMAEVSTEYYLEVVSEPQDAGWVARDLAKSAYDPDDEVTLTAIPADGFVFAGWSGDVPEEADLSQAELHLLMNGDLDIIAGFEAAQEVNNDGTTVTPAANRSVACGALGMLFWPMTILGLAAVRRR